MHAATCCGLLLAVFAVLQSLHALDISICWLRVSTASDRAVAQPADSCCLRKATTMAGHEPLAASVPLLDVAELAARENLGGGTASPLAPSGFACAASTGPKRRPCTELFGVPMAAEAEYCIGPPSKRWRKSADGAPWRTAQETTSPGADSCQQTPGPSPLLPAAQPCNGQEPGPATEGHAKQAATQTERSADDQQAGLPPLNPHGHQPEGLPDWCDKAPSLWVPEDGQVRGTAQHVAPARVVLLCRACRALQQRTILALASIQHIPAPSAHQTALCDAICGRHALVGLEYTFSPALVADTHSRLLPRGPMAQVEAFCYLPGHPLLALACEGQAKLLAKVLQMDADPDAKDSRGLTGEDPGRPSSGAGTGAWPPWSMIPAFVAKLGRVWQTVLLPGLTVAPAPVLRTLTGLQLSRDSAALRQT